MARGFFNHVYDTRVSIFVSSSLPTPPVPTVPTVSNITPAPGTPIYPDTPLQFDVTDTDGFSVIIPMITMDPFKVPEPTARGVSDDDFAFEPLYAQSTRVSIVDGYRYTLRRRGGWYATPSFRLWAVDTTGQVWVGP